jgi:type IV pilus biogenesis/stability protein PilW
MDALKKAQQIRSQESKAIPFFKEVNGRGAQRPTGQKYWAGLLIGGLGILLFISIWGSAPLVRFPSQAEQKMTSANGKEPVLPPANISEIHEPYPEEIPLQKIKPPGQPPKNPLKLLRAESAPRYSSTPTSTRAPGDPGIEEPLSLIAPLREEEKEELAAAERTAEKTKERKEESPLNTGGEKETSVPSLSSPKEAVPPSKSVEIVQVGGKEYSLAREVLTHFNRGVHLSQQRNFAGAAQAYEKVIELEPNYVEAYNNLAIVYQEMGDWEKARSTYQKSVEINPQYGKAHNNLGILLYLQERYEESIEAFQKALAVNPLNMESYINLGILFKKQGQIDKAIDSYQRALRINPLNPEAHYNVALLYEQLENWALAIGHYQIFIQLSSKNPSDLVFRVKRHLDDLSRARKEMSRGKGKENG